MNELSMRLSTLGAVATLAILGCNGNGNPNGTPAASSATAAPRARTTPASSTPAGRTAPAGPTTPAVPTAPAAPVTSAATTAPALSATSWAYPGFTGAAPSASASSAAAGASPAGASPVGASPAGASPAGASPAGTSPAGTSPAGISSPAGTSPAGAPPLAGLGGTAAVGSGVLLRGTIPFDPGVGFTGLLFLSGERFAPGSSVLVSYQGTPVVLLPGVFFSSQVLGVTVTFTVAGDYTFTAVAPDGSSSPALTKTIAAQPATSGFSLAAPEVQMVWPPSTDTSFMGTVWIMGEHFLPGASLVGNGPTGPFVMPLSFVNERTLGWITATPIAGSYSLAVMNPTFATSKAVTITVGVPSAPAGTLAAPTLAYTQTSVAAPFVGSVRVYGKGFLPGAVLELKDTATGTIAVTPLVFVGSSEVWWMLVYPASGSYEATLRNPDGQATTSWPFSVN